MATQEALETEAKYLTLKQLSRDVNLRLSDPLDVLPTSSAINLFSVSNSRGLAAAATRDGFIVHPLAALRSAFTSAARNAKPRLEAPQCVLSTANLGGSRLVFLRFADAGQRLLAGFANGVIVVWEVDALLAQKYDPQVTLQPPSQGLRLIELAPNPSDRPELCVALFSQQPASHATDAGTAIVFDVRTGAWGSQLETNSRCTSLAWSVRGKQIAIGLESGEIAQVTPDGAEKDRIARPPALEAHVYVHDLRWLENNVFCATYDTPAQPDADEPPHRYEVYAILRDPKSPTPLTYVHFSVDPAPAFGDTARKGRRFAAWLKGWEPTRHLVFVASAPSCDVGLLGCAAADGAWASLELEETSRPVLPLAADDKDTAPIGLELDFTAIDSVEDPAALARGEEDAPRLPATPILYIYTTDGLLLAYNVINTEGGPYPVMQNAETATSTASATVPGAAPLAASAPNPTAIGTLPNSESPAPFSFGSQPPSSTAPSTGVFGAPTTFGAKPTFGAPSAFGGSSAFGGTSVFGAPPAFGSPLAFGKPAAAAASSSSSPFASSSGFSAFGTPSAAGGGFGGFGGASSSSSGFGSFASQATSFDKTAPVAGGSIFGSGAASEAALTPKTTPFGSGATGSFGSNATPSPFAASSSVFRTGSTIQQAPPTSVAEAVPGAEASSAFSFGGMDSMLADDAAGVAEAESNEAAMSDDPPASAEPASVATSVASVPPVAAGISAFGASASPSSTSSPFKVSFGNAATGAQSPFAAAAGASSPSAFGAPAAFGSAGKQPVSSFGSSTGFSFGAATAAVTEKSASTPATPDAQARKEAGVTLPTHEHANGAKDQASQDPVVDKDAIGEADKDKGKKREEGSQQENEADEMVPPEPVDEEEDEKTVDEGSTTPNPVESSILVTSPAAEVKQESAARSPDAATADPGTTQVKTPFAVNKSSTTQDATKAPFSFASLPAGTESKKENPSKFSFATSTAATTEGSAKFSFASPSETQNKEPAKAKDESAKFGSLSGSNTPKPSFSFGPPAEKKEGAFSFGQPHSSKTKTIERDVAGAGSHGTDGGSGDDERSERGDASKRSRRGAEEENNDGESGLKMSLGFGGSKSPTHQSRSPFGTAVHASKSPENAPKPLPGPFNFNIPSSRASTPTTAATAAPAKFSFVGTASSANTPSFDSSAASSVSTSQSPLNAVAPAPPPTFSFGSTSTPAQKTELSSNVPKRTVSFGLGQSAQSPESFIGGDASQSINVKSPGWTNTRAPRSSSPLAGAPVNRGDLSASASSRMDGSTVSAAPAEQKPEPFSFSRAPQTRPLPKSLNNTFANADVPSTPPLPPSVAPAPPVTAPTRIQQQSAAPIPFRDIQPPRLGGLPNNVNVEEVAETGLQAEFLKTFMIMEKELQALKGNVEECVAFQADLRGPSGQPQSVEDFSDPSLWRFGDLKTLVRLAKQLGDNVAQLEERSYAQKRALTELHSLQLKCEAKREEAARFLRARSDPEFAKLVRVRTLGPAHVEKQSELRKKSQAVRDGLSELEEYLALLKKRIAEDRIGRPTMRVPSLDSIQRTIRNISASVHERLFDLDELEMQVNLLQRSDGRRSTTIARGETPVRSSAANRFDRMASSLSRALPSASGSWALSSEPTEAVRIALEAKQHASAMCAVFQAARRQPLLNRNAEESQIADTSKGRDFDLADLKMVFAKGPVRAPKREALLVPGPPTKAVAGFSNGQSERGPLSAGAPVAAAAPPPLPPPFASFASPPSSGPFADLTLPSADVPFNPGGRDSESPSSGARLVGKPRRTSSKASAIPLPSERLVSDSSSSTSSSFFGPPAPVKVSSAFLPQGAAPVGGGFSFGVPAPIQRAAGQGFTTFAGLQETKPLSAGTSGSTTPTKAPASTGGGFASFTGFGPAKSAGGATSAGME